MSETETAKISRAMSLVNVMVLFQWHPKRPSSSSSSSLSLTGGGK
jgi:hypothetical protein